MILNSSDTLLFCSATLVVLSAMLLYQIARIRKKLKLERIEHTAKELALENAVKYLHADQAELISSLNYKRKEYNDCYLELTRLQTLHEKLKGKHEKALAMVSELRNRTKAYDFTVTVIKTPETDIRVLQADAREQLMLALQGEGLITYRILETYNAPWKETELAVKASIKISKIK